MSKDFKIGVRAFGKVLKQALAQTYSSVTEFDNESDFKYELFHRLHTLKVSDYKLGDILTGYPTSILHAEANPVNGMRGQNSKADLLICNPTIQREYNYKSEIVIELKKALSKNDLMTEIDKFSRYDGAVPKLYIVSANKLKINRTSIKRILLERKTPNASIDVLDRNLILNSGVSNNTPRRRRRPRARTTAAERVAKCVKFTLRLYGDNRTDRFHSFFWRNYEPETERHWTFPCEGDFIAQLYHRLRIEFRQSAVVRTEYQPLSASTAKRVDLFLEIADETVGVEVKMNYDNFKRSSKRDEVESLAEKFDAMSRDNPNHTNMLVVIQGQEGYKGSSKRQTLNRLRKTGSNFSLLYYAELENKPVGPVTLEQA